MMIADFQILLKELVHPLAFPFSYAWHNFLFRIPLRFFMESVSIGFILLLYYLLYVMTSQLTFYCTHILL